MRATGEDVANVLRLLGAAFPTFPLDELTIEAYVRTLTAGPLEAATLNAAAVAWVASEDRYPTVHQLSDAYVAAGRREYANRRAAEDARIQAAGMLPGVALDPGYAVEMVDVMREALGSIGTGVLRHYHPDGDADRCPTCSRSDEIADGVAEHAVRVAAARGLRPPVGVETYVCHRCADLTWVETEPGTARPCQDCRPEAYERWIDGHLMPGHVCAECRG